MWAGLAKYRKLGNLKNRKVWSHSSEEGLVPSEGGEGECSMPFSCFWWSGGVSRLIEAPP